MSKPWDCMECGAQYPAGWKFEDNVDIDKMLTEIKRLRQALQSIVDTPVIRTWADWGEKITKAKEALETPNALDPS